MNTNFAINYLDLIFEVGKMKFTTSACSRLTLIFVQVGIYGELAIYTGGVWRRNFVLYSIDGMDRGHK